MSRADVEQHQQWIRDVRDPAEKAKEERTIRHGKCETTYSLAPIPTGWAWQVSTWVPNDRGAPSYSGTPWRAAPTRDAALAACQDRVLRDSSGRSDLQAFYDLVVAELQPDLFGSGDPS